MTITAAGKKLTFEEWYKKVDLFIQHICGLSRDDLPDQPYRDWYDSRVGPHTAATRAIRRAKSEYGL